MNDLIFLKTLPSELFYIIVGYNPKSVFIYHTREDWFRLNWIRLLKLNFNRDYQNTLLSIGDLVKIYLDCCWPKMVCGRTEYVVIDDDVISNHSAERNTFLVAYGSQHMFILLRDGTLLCRGSNELGQLGLGDFVLRDNFVRNDYYFGKNIAGIACGRYHTLVLLINGKVFTSGGISRGEIGSAFEPKNNFTEVENIKDVVQIACGFDYSFIKLKDGSIMAYGGGFWGQLGLGEIKRVSLFTKIEYISNVREIACGGCTTFLLMKDGTVMSTGYNNSGVLGHGDRLHRNMFKRVKNLPKNIIKIQAGFDHAICLLSNKTVMTCGSNTTGELGFPDIRSRCIFKVVKDFSGRVADIGTGPFAKYTILRLVDGSLIKYGIEAK
ncbi:MAG: RCC1 domain-containing protein 1 [Harvfovirus sp.]|uniref:RCC1 domain-containing protein 1 n=1 Tax=Harvfovirus sp. TaxID=2487768 RepID=A0A3G5A5I8_9VIRU|nr:MAG: RCC1 domain-containing protein 1 [Harvfovirus sp.]